MSDPREGEQSSAQTEIVLRFRYTEKEYLSAVRMYFGRTLNPGRDLVLAPIFLVGALYWWRSSGYDWILVVLIVMSALLLAMAVYLIVVTPRLHWRRQPKLREEYSIKFRDDGIAFETQHVDSKLSWSIYESVLENDRFFVLVYGRDQFSVIPKRAFSNRDQESAFRELVARKIPGKRS